MSKKSYLKILPLILFTSQAHAFVYVDSEGFEFNDLGVLSGQLTAIYDGMEPGVWISSGAFESFAAIDDFIANSGSKSLVIGRAADEDVRLSVQTPLAPPSSFTSIFWSMRVEENSDGFVNNAFGPFFGIEALQVNAGGTSRFGSFGVDATTGELLYTSSSGFEVVPSIIVPFGEWNDFRIDIDPTFGMYGGYFNGELVFAEFFEDSDATQLTDAAISAFSASFDVNSQATTGLAFFDDYFVTTTSPIPEPSTGICALLGALVLLRRRDRQALNL